VTTEDSKPRSAPKHLVVQGNPPARNQRFGARCRKAGRSIVVLCDRVPVGYKKGSMILPDGGTRGTKAT
jgi:hypothetical protein